MNQITIVATFLVSVYAIAQLALRLRTLQGMRDCKDTMSETDKAKFNVVLATTILTFVLVMNFSVFIGQWVYPREIGYHLHGVFAAALVSMAACIISSKNLTQFCASFFSVLPSFFMLQQIPIVLILAPVGLAVVSVLLHVMLPRLCFIENIADYCVDYADKKVLGYFDKTTENGNTRQD